MDRSKIKVLVACEYSGTVRDAFLELGFDAWSCDILPCESDIQDRHYEEMSLTSWIKVGT
jgi:hypothetical protein